MYRIQKISDTAVGPYNVTISLLLLVEDVDLVHLLENEALFDVCTSIFKFAQPTYRDQNYLITLIFVLTSIYVSQEI